MKKTRFLLLLILAIGIALLPKGAAKAATTITTCEQLQDMNLNLSETYTLGNDIDCTATTGWNSGAGFLPVGSSGSPFTGSLDGQNHKIIGLFIDRPSANQVGLFGSSQDASVSNLTMQGGSITGQNNVGSIVGLLKSTNLSNINSNMTITGIVNYIGGIVGWNPNQTSSLATLTNVHFSGSVTASETSYGIAGLVGDNDANIEIIESSNTGSVAGGYDYVGGLVGDNDALVTIVKSFNSGKVTAKGDSDSVAGLVGWSGDVDISDSYNTGEIIGVRNVGGLLGTVGAATIARSYSSGAITGTEATSTGALVGSWDSLTMTNTFWNTESSGQAVPCGTDFSCTEEATGITSAQMRTQSTFTDVTWDFEKVWGICAAFNNGFPYLLWQNPSCVAPTPTPGLPNTGAGSINIEYSNNWAIDNLLKF